MRVGGGALGGDADLTDACLVDARKSCGAVGCTGARNDTKAACSRADATCRIAPEGRAIREEWIAIGGAETGGGVGVSAQTQSAIIGTSACGASTLLEGAVAAACGVDHAAGIADRAIRKDSALVYGRTDAAKGAAKRGASEVRSAGCGGGALFSANGSARLKGQTGSSCSADRRRRAARHAAQTSPHDRVAVEGDAGESGPTDFGHIVACRSIGDRAAKLVFFGVSIHASAAARLHGFTIAFAVCTRLSRGGAAFKTISGGVLGKL